MTKKDTKEILNTGFSWQDTVNIEKGDYLYVPEDKIETLYFLEEGEIRQFSISPVGEEITIHIFQKPSIIPLMVILADVDNQFYFQAKTKLKCKTIEVDLFLEQMKLNPEFLLDLSHRFAGAVAGLSSRVNTMASYKQKDQLLGILRYLGTKQKQNSPLAAPLEVQTISHSELAQWLGCARETVSRLLSILEKEGKITKSAKKWIIHP